MNDLDTDRATAEYLGVTTKWLAQQRWLHQGPPYAKVGRAVRYRRTDVDRWLEQHTVRHEGRAS